MPEATRRGPIPGSRSTVGLKFTLFKSSQSLDSNAQGNEGDCQCCPSHLEAIADKLQSILTILERDEPKESQPLAPSDDKTVSNGELDSVLRKSFGPMTMNRGENSRFSEPLS